MVSRDVNRLAAFDLVFEYSSDDFTAGILVVTECIVGFIMLTGVIVGCYRIPALKSPFGSLMINQNLSQLIACTNSGLFFALGVLLDLRPIVGHSNYFGNMSIYLLPVILGSFLLMSANRFCASAFPFSYNRIFDRRLTMPTMFVLNWTLSASAALFLFLVSECNFRFYHFGWLFTEDVRNAKCGSIIVYYAMIVQIVLCFLIFVLDLATLVNLMCYRSKLYQLHHSAEVRRRETSFALQVLIQGVVFVMHGFWYDMGYSWMPGDAEKWKIFFTTSFSANLLHVFDPLIVFAFNREFRKWLFSKQKKQPNITMVTSVAVK